MRVLTNFYSAPLPVGLEVQAKVHSAYVEIWHQGQCVARHERCFNRQQKVLNLEHYLEALTKKPGAFRGFDTAGAVAGTGALAGELRSFLGGAAAADKAPEEPEP